jgi:hypothetical protein
MPAVASTQQSEVPTYSANITVSIPLNTGTVDANVSRIQMASFFLLLTFQLHNERQPRQRLQAAGAVTKLAWTVKTHQPQSALQLSSAS